MIKGIVDRFEGDFLVVEIARDDQKILMVDILKENLDPQVKEGDCLQIISVNQKSFPDSNFFKDEEEEAEALEAFLTPLRKKTVCQILLDEDASKERSLQMEELFSSLFK